MRGGIGAGSFATNDQPGGGKRAARSGGSGGECENEQTHLRIENVAFRDASRFRFEFRYESAGEWFVEQEEQDAMRRAGHEGTMRCGWRWAHSRGPVGTRVG